MNEVVSIIVPTFNRQHLFPRLYECFQKQDYSKVELLIYDDTKRPSAFFSNLPKVRYFHSEKRLSIGEKRNFLARKAAGDIIAHFDDDDFYMPNYISYMINNLGQGPIVKLSSWFIYSVTHKMFGYWDTGSRGAVRFLVKPGRPVRPVRAADPLDANLKGYGFSYVYRKSIIEKVPFPDQYHGEDYEWIQKIEERNPIKFVADSEGVVLHIVHNSNTSCVFPQYHLPLALLPKIFTEDVLRYIAL